MTDTIAELRIGTKLYLPGTPGTRLNTTFATTELTQTDNAEFAIPLTDVRVWDAMGSPLPSAGAADDLGLVAGTFATASPTLQTLDAKTLTTTVYGRFQCVLPDRYVAAQSVTLRLHAGQLTTVADTTCDLDVQAYLVDGEGGIGSDLCATAAQSIKTLTFADKDFVITSSGLSPGDVLDVRIAISIVDAATGTAVIGAVGKITLLCDIQG